MNPSCPECGRPLIFWSSDKGVYCPDCERDKGNNIKYFLIYDNIRKEYFDTIKERNNRYKILQTMGVEIQFFGQEETHVNRTENL